MTIAEMEPAVEPIMHTLHVIDGEGDSRITWNPTNTDEVRAARAHFDMLKGQGYLAYRVDRDGNHDGEAIRDFDPEAGQIVMSPPLQGG